MVDKNQNNQDNLEELWINLGKKLDGFTVSLERFRADMADEGMRTELHGNLPKYFPGFNIDYEMFSSDMGFKKKEVAEYPSPPSFSEYSEATESRISEMITAAKMSYEEEAKAKGLENAMGLTGDRLILSEEQIERLKKVSEIDPVFADRMTPENISDYKKMMVRSDAYYEGLAQKELDKRIKEKNLLVVYKDQRQFKEQDMAKWKEGHIEAVVRLNPEITKKDAKQYFIREEIPELETLMTNMLLSHPGFTDSFVLSTEKEADNFKQRYREQGFYDEAVDIAYNNVYQREYKDKIIRGGYNDWLADTKKKNPGASEEEVYKAMAFEAYTMGKRFFSPEDNLVAESIKKIEEYKQQLGEIQKKGISEENYTEYQNVLHKMQKSQEDIAAIAGEGRKEVYDYVTGERITDPNFIAQQEEDVKAKMEEVAATINATPGSVNFQNELKTMWIEAAGAVNYLKKKHSEVFSTKEAMQTIPSTGPATWFMTKTAGAAPGGFRKEVKHYRDLTRNAMLEFDALSRFYLLNESPANIDKNWSYYKQTIGNDIMRWLPLSDEAYINLPSTPRNFLDAIQMAGEREGIGFSDEEKEKFERSLTEHTVEFGIGLVPIMIQLALLNKVVGITGAAKFLQALRQGSKIQKMLAFLGDLALEEAKLQTAGFPAGEGVGFGLAHKIPMFKLPGKYGAYAAPFVRSVWLGSIGATMGLEMAKASSITFDAFMNDKDWTYRMDQYFGDMDENQKRWISALIVNQSIGTMNYRFLNSAFVFGEPKDIMIMAEKAIRKGDFDLGKDLVFKAKQIEYSRDLKTFETFMKNREVMEQKIKDNEAKPEQVADINRWLEERAPNVLVRTGDLSGVEGTTFAGMEGKNKYMDPRMIEKGGNVVYDVSDVIIADIYNKETRDKILDQAIKLGEHQLSRIPVKSLTHTRERLEKGLETLRTIKEKGLVADFMDANLENLIVDAAKSFQFDGIHVWDVKRPDVPTERLIWNLEKVETIKVELKKEGIKDAVPKEKPKAPEKGVEPKPKEEVKKKPEEEPKKPIPEKPVEKPSKEIPPEKKPIEKEPGKPVEKEPVEKVKKEFPVKAEDVTDKGVTDFIKEAKKDIEEDLKFAKTKGNEPLERVSKADLKLLETNVGKYIDKRIEEAEKTRLVDKDKELDRLKGLRGKLVAKPVKKEIVKEPIPKGWKAEVQPNWRRTKGWKAEVDWKDKRIVFETKEDLESVEINNHEIAHIIIENKLIKEIEFSVQKMKDVKSQLLLDFAEITDEMDIHPNFVREHLAMDYGNYLGDPAKVSVEKRKLFEKHNLSKEKEIAKKLTKKPVVPAEKVTRDEIVERELKKEVPREKERIDEDIFDYERNLLSKELLDIKALEKIDIKDITDPDSKHYNEEMAKAEERIEELNTLIPRLEKGSVADKHNAGIAEKERKGLTEKLESYQEKYTKGAELVYRKLWDEFKDRVKEEDKTITDKEIEANAEAWKDYLFGDEQGISPATRKENSWRGYDLKAIINKAAKEFAGMDLKETRTEIREEAIRMAESEIKGKEKPIAPAQKEKPTEEFASIERLPTKKKAVATTIDQKYKAQKKIDDGLNQIKEVLEGKLTKRLVPDQPRDEKELKAFLEGSRNVIEGFINKGYYNLTEMVNIMRQSLSEKQMKELLPRLQEAYRDLYMSGKLKDELLVNMETPDSFDRLTEEHISKLYKENKTGELFFSTGEGFSQKDVLEEVKIPKEARAKENTRFKVGANQIIDAVSNDFINTEKLTSENKKSLDNLLGDVKGDLKDIAFKQEVGEGIEADPSIKIRNEILNKKVDAAKSLNDLRNLLEANMELFDRPSIDKSIKAQKRMVDLMNTIRKESPEAISKANKEKLVYDYLDEHSSAEEHFASPKKMVPKEPRIDIEPISERFTEGPLGLEELLAKVSKRTGKRMHISKPGKRKGVAGVYNPQWQSIRMKRHNQIDVFAHELGHFVDDVYGVMSEWKDELVSPYDNELKSFWIHGSKPPSSMKTKVDRRRYIRGEGVAEWIRAYIVNPVEAKKAAPQFYKNFTKKVSHDYLEAIQEYSNLYRAWAGQSATNKTLGQIAKETNIKHFAGFEFKNWYNKRNYDDPFSFTVWDKVREIMSDDLHFMKIAAEYAMKINPQKPLPENNPLMLVSLHSQVGGLVDRMLRLGLMDTQKKRRMDSETEEEMPFSYLFKELRTDSSKELERELQLTVAYMVSERTLFDLHKNMPDAKVLTGAGGGVFSDINIAKATLKEINDLKTTDPAKFKRIKETARRYREWANYNLRYMVEGGRMSEDLYQKIKKNNDYYVAMARVMNSSPTEEIFMYARGAKGALGYVTEVIHPIKGSARTMLNPYESLIMSTYKSVRETDRNSVVRAYVDVFDLKRGQYDPVNVMPGMDQLVMRIDPSKATKEKLEKSVMVFRDGEKEYYKVHEIIDLALNELGTAEMLPWSGPEMIMKGLSFVPQIVRKSVIYSPAFPVVNSVRDIFHRLVVSASEEGGVTGLKDMLEGEVGVRELRDYSGDMAGFYYKNQYNYISFLKRSMKDEVSRGKSIIVDPLKMTRAFKRGYMGYVESGETANRVAEFRNSFRHAKYKLGYNDHNASIYAAFKSRELIDFAVAGTLMRQINRIFIFSNPMIQGLKAVVRSGRRDPAKFSLNFMKFVLMPTAMEYALALAGDYNDERRQLPSYIKDLYWNFKMGPDLWVRVPKPFELGVASSMLHRVFDAMMPMKVTDPKTGRVSYVRDKHAFDGYLGSVLTAFQPFDKQHIFSMSFLPAGIVDIKVNADMFQNRYVVPPDQHKLDYKYLYYERGGEKIRFDVHASPLGKMIGKSIGLDARKVDHIFMKQFTYFGQYMTKGSRLLEKGKPIDATITPFVRKSDVYASRDVQWVMKKAEKIGLTNRFGKTSNSEYGYLVERLRWAYDADEDVRKANPSKSRAELRKLIRIESDKRKEAVRSIATNIMLLWEKMGLPEK